MLLACLSLNSLLVGGATSGPTPPPAHGGGGGIFWEFCSPSLWNTLRSLGPRSSTTSIPTHTHTHTETDRESSVRSSFRPVAPRCCARSSGFCASPSMFLPDVAPQCALVLGFTWLAALAHTPHTPPQTSGERLSTRNLSSSHLAAACPFDAL